MFDPDFDSDFEKGISRAAKAKVNDSELTKKTKNPAFWAGLLFK